MHPQLLGKFEIMSPVGSLESLMAAIQGGADAVYFGIGKLNMRSRSSQNFTISDLDNITEICLKQNVKKYLTLNTVVYDTEIEEVEAILDAAIKSKIDAVIASDMAVINLALKKGLPVHASTQCNISNFEAVKYYAKFCDVLVLARELNIKQVKHICSLIQSEKIKGKSGQILRIEAFIHGALCMSISGKCYLSLDNMNYSANRGACLQLCRRKYNVKDTEEQHEYVVDGAYIMSPKDLCTIQFLDKIVHAGVSVFKIEGRGRSPEYVKTVTQCYKEALESITEKTYNPHKISKWLEKLSKVYNRGFWEGYYMGKKTGEWTEKYGSQAKTKKEYIGKITNYFSSLKVAEVKIETGSIQLNDEILIIGNTTGVLETSIQEIRFELKSVQSVVKGQTCSIPVSTTLRRGDKIYKVINVIEDDFTE